ncbi:MAG: hypothetical protein HFE04_00165 [Bacilli bacterium]|nr:hypothetical protein [Bacilli bacterium]
MITYIIKTGAICLLSTIIIELIVALLLKVRHKIDLIYIIIVNIITNPLVVMIPLYLNIKYGLLERNISLGILEFATIFFEGNTYKKYLEYNKINPYIFSVILNASSYLIGILINYIIY